MVKNVEIDESLCTGCGACVSMCPMRILKMDNKEGVAKVTDHESCDMLGGCMHVCPTGAIKINMQNRMKQVFNFRF